MLCHISLYPLPLKGRKSPWRGLASRLSSSCGAPLWLRFARSGSCPLWSVTPDRQQTRVIASQRAAHVPALGELRGRNDWIEKRSQLRQSVEEDYAASSASIKSGFALFALVLRWLGILARWSIELVMQIDRLVAMPHTTRYRVVRGFACLVIRTYCVRVCVCVIAA